MKTLLLALLTAGFLACTATADTVTLDDGSILKGTITKTDNGKLVLDTVFAGTLKLDLTQVTSIETTEAFNVELASGNRLVGPLAVEGGRKVVTTVNGAIPIEGDEIVDIWAPGEPSPTVKAVEAQRRKWKYEAAVDLNGRSGNTDRTAFAGSAKAVLEGPEDKLLFYGRKQYAETEGDTTVDETIGGIDFERIINERHSWYVRGEVERDDIERLDLRTTVAGGYGYYFIRSAEHELRGRLGALYRHESYEVREDDSTLGADLSLNHMYRFSENVRMVNELVWTPSIEDTSDYRVWHESSLEFPLTSQRMKMAIGISNEYNSIVPAGIEELDTYYFVRLILSWQ